MLNSSSRSDRGQRNSVKITKGPLGRETKAWPDVLTATRRATANTHAAENKLFGLELAKAQD